MKMLILGAGLQGCACAYDLLQNPAVSQVTLADYRLGTLPPAGRLVPSALDLDGDVKHG